MKYADLHLHTYYSDGTFKPLQLVKRAKKAGLSCISVTDHDTVQGIEEVSNFSQAFDIENIPGIEITSNYEKEEVHILGYFIDYRNKDLLNLLDKLSHARIKRVHAIVKKLKKCNIDLEAQEVFDLAKAGTVGRLHIARVMKNNGFVASTNEAFRKFIGQGAPAYISRLRVEVKEAIDMIKASGGIAVLAHPFTLIDEANIPKLIKLGIQGLEVFYPDIFKDNQERFISLAHKHKILITGGSDCHGMAKEKTKIGMIKVPYNLVKKLKDARQ